MTAESPPLELSTGGRSGLAISLTAEAPFSQASARSASAACALAFGPKAQPAHALGLWTCAPELDCRASTGGKAGCAAVLHVYLVVQCAGPDAPWAPLSHMQVVPLAATPSVELSLTNRPVADLQQQTPGEQQPGGPTFRLYRTDDPSAPPATATCSEWDAVRPNRPDRHICRCACVIDRAPL